MYAFGKCYVLYIIYHMGMIIILKKKLPSRWLPVRVALIIRLFVSAVREYIH